MRKQPPSCVNEGVNVPPLDPSVVGATTATLAPGFTNVMLLRLGSAAMIGTKPAEERLLIAVTVPPARGNVAVNLLRAATAVCMLV